MKRPLWQRFDEAAKNADKTGDAYRTHDLVQAAFSRGRASAFRDAAVLARGCKKADT